MSTYSPAYARTLLYKGQLPENSVVTATLSIQPYVPVPSIPPGIHFMETLECVESPTLSLIGDGVRVDQVLVLEGSRLLKAVGRDLTVGLSCSFSGCSSLRSIGTGLKVGGSLSLDGCPRDIILPPEGDVGGSLTLPFGYDLARFPLGLRVGGGIHVEHLPEHE